MRRSFNIEWFVYSRRTEEQVGRLKALKEQAFWREELRRQRRDTK